MLRRGGLRSTRHEAAQSENIAIADLARRRRQGLIELSVDRAGRERVGEVNGSGDDE